MLLAKNISICFNLQQFECNSFEIDDENHKCHALMSSNQDTDSVVCPLCGGKVHVHGKSIVTLKDMPVYAGFEQYITALVHQYRCQKCGNSFTEDIGFKYPHTRVTKRAVQWIASFLKQRMSIKAVQDITGIHWNTISKIHKDIMNEALQCRQYELQEQHYKPKHIAVDEFAIHKGHTYATCVMDLDEGDILWVGKGRAMLDFEKFFKEIDMDYLSDVEAVAMDMNASYNKLVEEYLPNAVIVYDRYHMQAQFGKDVIGSVRLQEAREHQQRAKEIEKLMSGNVDKGTRKEFKKEAKAEHKLYSELKRSRWNLLTNSKNLREDKAEHLNKILQEHNKLAVCYAMKEELCNLFDLRDFDEASIKWNNWFNAADESDIEQLMKFAWLKRKRMSGLVAHADYPISTGKLEGFNNKIKVTKRIGFGYRNEEYFFTLLKYNSLPCNRCQSPKKT